MQPFIKHPVLVLLTGLSFFISCTKEHSCENCRGANRPPIARAGADITISLPKDSILLDGSASTDPDGPITSYKWTGLTAPGPSGTAAPGSSSIQNPDSSKTRVRSLVTGVYSFELTVTDSAGLSSKDIIQVTVKNPSQPNRPPIADVGADLADTLPNNAITLDARASHDPDNNITAYSWRKIAGPDPFNLSNADSSQAKLTGMVQGIYYFELTVTDAGGLSAKDTVQVNVVIKSSPGQRTHTATPAHTGTTAYTGTTTNTGTMTHTGTMSHTGTTTNTGTMTHTGTMSHTGNSTHTGTPRAIMIASPMSPFSLSGRQFSSHGTRFPFRGVSAFPQTIPDPERNPA